MRLSQFYKNELQGQYTFAYQTEYIAKKHALKKKKNVWRSKICVIFIGCKLLPDQNKPYKITNVSSSNTSC